MKKALKTRKGFTLVEMVLVIAIIVILASVLIIGVGTYIQRARNAASSAEAHTAEMNVAIAAIDNDVTNG